MTDAEKAYQYFVVAIPENEEQSKAYFWARKALQPTLTPPNEWLYEKKVILDAIEGEIAGESAQEKELHRIKKALAYMWFAYEKKEEGSLNDVEKIAVKEAQEILGPWRECMRKYIDSRKNE